ncbi:MAG: putative sulfate exporter family transporter [Spirochaetota bacterium]
MEKTMQAGSVVLKKANKKESIWSLLPSMREAAPGLLAMAVIALFCELPGVPWPFTIANLLKYMDEVLPPIYGKRVFTDLLHFNYVLIALLIGIFIRNVIGVPKSWEPGLTYSAIFMNTAIIMLGSQYLLRDLVRIGTVAVILMVVFVFGSALVVILLGRLFKVSDALSGTMAGGVSCCGVSAVVATAPLVGAKSEEVTYSIATILSFGLIGLFTMPFIGRLLEMPDVTYGIWSAVGILNSAQVIASGFMYSFDAGKVAGFVNIARVVMIPAAVIFIGILILSRQITGTKINKWQVMKEKFPIFVLGFFIVWIARCLGWVPRPAVYAMEAVMTWFFTLSFVGLGLQTKLGDLKKAGIKGLMVGYTASTIKVALSCVAIIILIKLGLL